MWSSGQPAEDAMTSFEGRECDVRDRSWGAFYGDVAGASHVLALRREE